MTRKPAPATAPEAPAAPLPLMGGAWIIVDGQLVRDEAEPQTLPPPEADPSNPPSTEA